MKLLVIYYSYSGKTKKLAENMAQKRNADICEIKDAKRPGIIKAYTIGCIKALLGKGSPIMPLEADLNNYDKIVIAAPVWASHPAPAANTVIDSIPANKRIEILMVSASGQSKCKAKIAAKIKSHSSLMTDFKNIQTGSKKK